MIVLFTDYGFKGPYLGMVQGVLYQNAPQEKIVNLISDLPRQNIKAAAYLLSVCVSEFPPGTIFFAVVDPGVGTFTDNPVIFTIDNRYFVGPDNGVFDLVMRQGTSHECLKITWRPEKLSASFHGRDLYAPICAMLANNQNVPGKRISWQDKHNWPDNLAEIIYIDGFGNCMTGMRETFISEKSEIMIQDRKLKFANTFAEVSAGETFWYVNSLGLIEIAVNQGSASSNLNIDIGDEITVIN